MNTLVETISLHNGVEIPKIGFGTFQIQDGKEVINAVKNALIKCIYICPWNY